MMTRLARPAAVTAVITLVSLGTWIPAATPAAHAAAIPPPAHHGTLRVSGAPRDGATVTATGLRWHAPRLPRGMSLLSFEVAYSWQSCDAAGTHCRAGADSTAAPFAARRYTAGQADTGRRLRVTETASEVVQTQRNPFTFQVIRRSVSALTAAAVRAYPRHKPPVTAFVNGTPEPRTTSTEEYFQVAAPHANAADGTVAQRYRIDHGGWHAMPPDRVFYTGKLAPGPHRVTVRTASRAGATEITLRLAGRPAGPAAAPASRPPRAGTRRTWTAPATRCAGTGRSAGPPRCSAPGATRWTSTTSTASSPPGPRSPRSRPSWQASTLDHPRAVCYLDLAWEDYRPDATPGGAFPAAALGNIYFGFPEERWVDLRQLDALKPMLRERVAMCARKGFDAVELDDIDSFDPPSTTGFHLTPGDAQNFLAYAFNLIHQSGMTALWKNSPYLSWWGRQYADGAVVEECYVDHACFAAQFQGSRQYGITCTALSGATPCGWDDFTAAGQWVGEAEYAEDGYVCSPGQQCKGPHSFGTYCRSVYAVPHGFSAVKFDVDLDGKIFYPCRK